MRIDILTLFPDMCERVFRESITGRAIEAGHIEIYARYIRDYTKDKWGRCDDTPYGGGMGMLLKAQPIYDCWKSLRDELGYKPHTVYMSPQGQVLTQSKVRHLATFPEVAVLCGHYEGVDERVLDEIVDEEISIGDFVLTGGELPALCLADAIARMVPGVLSSEECFTEESHFSGLLEYPQYTKPYEWNGRTVPDILLSGHHANIQKWRRAQSLKRTREKRPDMFEKFEKENPDG
ncbi:MAG: tRNA (guanosine(37)-N1)-methyltransferase TrmD [Clostridia bacterium]|nr:tRNA (guanosine(37)-N1)-methyltransferase TrmD [Clostridia bacterium]